MNEIMNEVISLIKNKINYYENQRTYTDWEEAMRQGEISVLEDLLEDLEG